MANFGARLAYPAPERHRTPADATAPAAPRTVAATLRDIAASFLRAIDDAPYHLAWPPTPRPS